MALRLGAEDVLQPRHELILWRTTYRHFFRSIWLFIGIGSSTGYYGILSIYGGFADFSSYLYLMHIIGPIKVGIFCCLFFSSYRLFPRLIDGDVVTLASNFFEKIRLAMALNVVLGITFTVIGIWRPLLVF